MIRTLATAAAALLALAPAADAHWAAPGSGSAAVGVGDLQAPALTVPSTASGSVPLQLAPATLTGVEGAPESEIAYTVERRADGAAQWTAAAGTCAGTLAATTTTCTDEVGADGSYDYRVTATFRSWTAVATDGPVAVTLDQTPPTLTPAFPADGGSYNAAGWAAGCAAGAGICGTASDAGGIAAIVVSIRQESTRRYWDGGAFAATAETFQTATGTTSWRLPLTLPDDDLYKLHVRATDGAGNVTDLLLDFTIDTVAPAAPTSVALANGAGESSAWISAANAAGVNINVALPAGSSTDDTVTLTLSDQPGTHTLSRTAAAVAGTVSFTGIDLTSFADGRITASAHVTDRAGNVSGTTANAATMTKDVVAPTVSITAPLNGAVGVLKNNTPYSGTASTGTDDLTTLVLRVYQGGSTSGTLKYTLYPTVAPLLGTWTATGSGALAGKTLHLVQVQQYDRAYNVGTATATFTTG